MKCGKRVETFIFGLGFFLVKPTYITPNFRPTLLHWLWAFLLRLLGELYEFKIIFLTLDFVRENKSRQ